MHPDGPRCQGLLCDRYRSTRSSPRVENRDNGIHFHTKKRTDIFCVEHTLSFSHMQVYKLLDCIYRHFESLPSLFAMQPCSLFPENNKLVQKHGWNNDEAAFYNRCKSPTNGIKKLELQKCHCVSWQPQNSLPPLPHPPPLCKMCSSSIATRRHG